jgi:triosephosphate isomerase (TIM)
MRKMIIAGNWKMNKTISESIELAKSIKTSSNIDVIIAPTFTSLKSVSETINNNGIIVSAQNIHPKDSGAYTGEISPLMIKDAGCKTVILGHSERREYFNESNQLINEKIKKTLNYDINVILCVGENLDQRKTEKTNEILSEQLELGLSNINDLSKITIAYEPVWAIGTGEVASPEQAQETHSFIRNKIKSMYDEETSNKIRILYGGSMKPDNAEGLLNQQDIDGGLIGGASLNPEAFNKIISLAEKISQ